MNNRCSVGLHAWYYIHRHRNRYRVCTQCRCEQMYVSGIWLYTELASHRWSDSQGAEAARLVKANYENE